jgi:hypothetical protein
LSKALPHPFSCERTACSSKRPLWVKRTVVAPSVSSKSSSISCRVVSPSQIQVNARRVGGSISVYPSDFDLAALEQLAAA